MSGAPETTRQEINTWVSDRTNAKIPELLAPDSVRPDTSLMLTNTAYLKAANAENSDSLGAQVAISDDGRNLYG